MARDSLIDIRELLGELDALDAGGDAGGTGSVQPEQPEYALPEPQAAEQPEPPADEPPEPESDLLATRKGELLPQDWEWPEWRPELDESQPDLQPAESAATAADPRPDSIAAVHVPEPVPPAAVSTPAPAAPHAAELEFPEVSRGEQSEVEPVQSPARPAFVTPQPVGAPEHAAPAMPQPPAAVSGFSFADEWEQVVLPGREGRHVPGTDVSGAGAGGAGSAPAPRIRPELGDFPEFDQAAGEREAPLPEGGAADSEDAVPLFRPQVDTAPSYTQGRAPGPVPGDGNAAPVTLNVVLSGDRELAQELAGQILPHVQRLRDEILAETRNMIEVETALVDRGRGAY